ncbi:MAG: fumarylacetoacetate hydrolase family protein [Rhodocyclaceae bacterium]|jgi:fumarylacetoacetate (FAA) hydrolase|nr:fumarylacetoacetate hydrolase family protein [Rhodocyclaceae bacterium]
MKLASLKSKGRDGRLVVVSRDLSRQVEAGAIAPTLQAALDDWERCAPLLADLARALEQGSAPAAGDFHSEACAAPLPRAYQWADGSAYVNHVELVRRARGAEMPDHFWHEPLLYQGGSDILLGPRDPIIVADEAWGIDFEAEVAVITGDVPAGVSVHQAGRHIRLITLANDVSLRNLIPAELAKGFGFFQSKPPTAFAPVAATPDELGGAWDGARLHLPLRSFLNGAAYGWPDAGQDMTFGFPQLIAHAARTRPLGAGTLIGSGTVSNLDRTRGSSCIAERRMLETLDQGRATSPFLRFGDRVRIEMQDGAGRSIFGAIDQEVLPCP